MDIEDDDDDDSEYSPSLSANLCLTLLPSEKDEAKYVEDDLQRSKRHSERVARVMNSVCCNQYFPHS